MVPHYTSRPPVFGTFLFAARASFAIFDMHLAVDVCSNGALHFCAQCGLTTRLPEVWPGWTPTVHEPSRKDLRKPPAQTRQTPGLRNSGPREFGVGPNKRLAAECREPLQRTEPTCWTRPYRARHSSCLRSTAEARKGLMFICLSG